MARVRACGVCDHENGLEEIYCSACGAQLAYLPETESGSRRSAAAAETGEGNVMASSPSFHLEFPWGAQEIRGRLRIGRDESFSPLSAHLKPFGKVSGKHAEVFAESGKLFVRHLSNTNPTYVAGRPITQVNEVAELCDGDSVSFSTDMLARVRSTNHDQSHEAV